MNKARRHELKMLKYKKRLNQLGLTEGENKNFHAYRSHGAPCSCFMCSHSKYKRARLAREQAEQIMQGLNEAEQIRNGTLPALSMSHALSQISLKNISNSKYFQPD